MSTLRQPRRLEELLNYRLQKLLAASGAPVVRLLEGRYGIARREWRLLATLALRGAMSPSALALEMDLDRSRTSRAIGVLAAKGLLLRRTDSGDARRAEVALTFAGERLYSAALPHIAAANAEIVSVLDDATLDALDRALDALTAHARRVNQSLATDVKANRRAGGSRRILPERDTEPGWAAGRRR